MNKDKKIYNETITISEMIYLFYFSIMLFARGIGLYEGMLLYNISLVIGMLLFGLKILSTEHTLYEYFWMGALLILSLVVYRNTGEKGFLVYVTMMLGLKGVSLVRVFRTGLAVWAVAFGTLIILTLSHIIPERIYMHNKNGIGYLICHSLGYSHSNVLHISYIVLMMFIVYSVGRLSTKKLMLLSAALMVGNIYIFMYSVSYTGFIGATFFLVINLYLQLRKKISWFEKIVLQTLFPICVLFSILGPIVIKGRLFDLINKVLNTRFFLSNYFLTEQPITLFGSRLIVPNYRYTMDCSYVYVLVQLGIIPFTFICILFFALIRDCVINDRRIELAIILGLCISGVAEPFMFNLSYKNLIFIFAGSFLFRFFDKLSFKFPSQFNSSLIFFTIGKKRIIYRQIERWEKCRYLIHSYYSNKQLVRKRVFFTLITVFFVAVCFIHATPNPKHVYIDEDTNENMELKPVFFTSDEVSSLEDKGEIFYNYSSEDDGMYEYSGGTALTEYYREIISICLWTALIVGAACILIGDKKSQVRSLNP